jgi:excisionase family DNA binding protein
MRIQRALRDVVELRCAAREAANARQLDRIERIAQRRREDLDETVPKTRAAEALGVSVTTLDKWVARGKLPAARHGGSGRVEVPTEAVLELAEEVQQLREAGRRRGLLAEALRLVDQRRRGPAIGMPGYFPDPLRDRRRDFEQLSAAERVVQAIHLSRTATRIAAAAAARKSG